MIIFQNDFVRLRNETKWVQVVDINFPSEYREELVLSDNRVVSATWRHLEDVRSEAEHLDKLIESLEVA